MPLAPRPRLRRARRPVLLPLVIVALLAGLAPPAQAAPRPPTAAAPPPAAAPDTTAPSIPTGVAATAPAPDRVEVRWTSSTDDVGVTRYTIARNGTNLAIVDGSATSYVDRSTNPSTAYSYTVRASDAAANLSGASTAGNVTSPACGCATATARPTSDVSNAGFTPNAGSTRYTQLDETTSDNDSTYIQGPSSGTANAVVGVGAIPAGTIYGVTVRWTARQFVTNGQSGAMNAHVELFNGTTLLGTGTTRNLGTSYATNQDNFNVTLTSPTLRVKVVQETAGTNKRTSRFTFVQVTINYRAPDTTAPSVPAGLSANRVCANQLHLEWNAATDAVGVQGYRLFRGGTQIASVPVGATAPLRLFDFQTGAQGFVASGNAVSSSAGGILRGTADGPGAWSQVWTWTGTWEQLGVPAGATVSSIQLTRFLVGAEVQVAFGGDLSVGTVSVADGAGNPVGTLYSGRFLPNGVYQPQDAGPQGAVGISAAAGSTVQLQIAASVDSFDVYSTWTYDNLELRLGWTGGAGRVGITDTGLTANTEYRYRVAAVDAAGNASAQSPEIVARTSATGGASAPDADCDGVPDELEDILGTSGGDGDTDDDGLTDQFEAFKAYLAHDPAIADTDEDGTPDGAEDFDGDGLTALVEQQRGSDPLEADPDLDGLDDPAELNTHQTDPNDADTDDDGLDDGAEIALGTNPLDSDSDNDGILDGDETLTASIDGPDGATVEVDGTGDLADAVTIEDRTAEIGQSTNAGQKGATYEFTLDASTGATLTSADITLPYDPADPTLGDPSDLAIFTLDQSTGMWLPAAATVTVDQTAHTVSATVSHFSVFAVFNLAEWVAFWSGAACENDPDPGAISWVDVALVIDSSGSMTSNDPNNLRLQASKNFVDLLSPQINGQGGDRGAVVDFDFVGILRQALTMDKVALKAAIDLIDASGGTSLSAGMQVGLDELIRVPAEASRQRVVIMLTDGIGDYSSFYTQRAIDNDVIVFTIGLGSGVNQALLQNIATSTGGQYFPASSAAELEQIFQDIGGEIDADRDDDGLTDCQEIDGLTTGWGTTYTSDPLDPDTDDDGLPDGAEMYRVAQTFLGFPVDLNVVLSDPRQTDSDLDGLRDGEEAEVGTWGLEPDSDHDGLNDADEMFDGLDPLSNDTDRDGFDDKREVDHPDQGFDPLFYDPPETGASWAEDFAAGLALGDFNERDSVAWMLGSLASGFVVAGDVRDVLANVVQLDFVGVLFAGVAIIPAIGDATRVTQKISEFIGRHADKADELFAALVRLDVIPREVKIAVLRMFRGADFDALVARAVSEDDILKLAKARHGINGLANVLNRVTAKFGDDAIEHAGRWFPGGRAGGRPAEEFIQQSLGGPVTRTGLKSPESWRFPDHRTGNAALPDMHEVKTGLATDGPRLKRQALKDVQLVAGVPPDFPRQASSITWHFLASEASSTLGPTDELLTYFDDLAAQYGVTIEIKIWLP